MIVLDTSALLYWTIDRDKLTSKAAEAIAKSDAIMISSISIWEIGIKVKKNRLTLSHPFKTFVEKLINIDKVELLPVTVETWITNVELEWGHRDPADRTIVATAVNLNCPLITSDRKMQSFYSKAIW